jgi:ubiquinone/menaquinone biosynthesis C-methylase UbiE
MTVEEQRPADAVRTHVHGMWATVAGQWAAHADDIDARVAVLTERMLASCALQSGDRVLDLACGPGGAGLAAAERLEPTGEVVLSDVVGAMTTLAAARAARRGLTNVRTAVLDLEHVDQPDAGYDAVLCREGLMFAVDPQLAVAEIRRVLRPGGRVAISVWGPPAENPWLALVFAAVTAETGSPIPPPGVPGPFSLGDRGQLEGLLLGAGLDGVAVDEVAVPLRSPSFDAWWARTAAVAGPLAAVLADLPAGVVAAVRDRLRVATAPYASAAGLDLPGLALLATGRRPGT